MFHWKEGCRLRFPLPSCWRGDCPISLGRLDIHSVNSRKRASRLRGPLRVPPEGVVIHRKSDSVRKSFLVVSVVWRHVLTGRNGALHPPLVVFFFALRRREKARDSCFRFP
ncbi:hypothetical protein AVEN_265971-1 [Araneus ventricosus]|uniref:Uncharacterized protein n=1 Tax=Araneus ventricosus TaxID=182803 RepID=A0A4Y2GLP8_ARAVE|nr:hypothetical protein AVEN_265971-1 [Araneus ventricosus]